MKKSAISVILAGVMTAVALGACGGTDQGATPAASATSEESTTPTAATDSDTIKIGYISDLSGATTLWGQAGLNGAMMAVEDINEKGGVLGKKIEVVAGDGKGEATDSVNALKKLITSDGIVAEVGTNFSSCNIPMAEVADEMKVPIIGTATSNELVTQDENGNLKPYSFRMCFLDSYMGTVMGNYLVEKMGYKSAAILSDNTSAYSVAISDFFTKAFEEKGGKVVANEQIQSSDTDFRSVLSKIASKEFDVLFLPLTDYDKIATIASQARSLGMKCQFAGGDGWDSDELAGMAGGALDGGIYVLRIGFNSKEGQAFKERYVKKYNINAEGECLFGYDGVSWICQAIEKAGSADPTAIRDALENTAEFKGLIGTLVMDPKTHNPQMDAAIYECKGKKFKYKETVKVSDVK